MPAEAPVDFGTRLRRAREQRGLSLRQVADVTKISVLALEALERNEVSRLPGGIFSRAFVRAYAKEVGLDVEQTVREFVAQFPSDDAAPDERAGRRAPRGALGVGSDGSGLKVTLRVLAVVVPIALLLLYLVWSGRLASWTRPVASTPALEPPPVASPKLEATAGLTLPPLSDVGRSLLPEVESAARIDLTGPPVLAGTTVLPGPAADAPIRLVIAPNGPCWVSAYADGAAVFAELLASGDRRVVAGRQEVILKVGDAGSFLYTINERPGRSLGGAGRVVTVRITPETVPSLMEPR